MNQLKFKMKTKTLFFISFFIILSINSVFATEYFITHYLDTDLNITTDVDLKIYSYPKNYTNQVVFSLCSLEKNKTTGYYNFSNSLNNDFFCFYKANIKTYMPIIEDNNFNYFISENNSNLSIYDLMTILNFDSDNLFVSNDRYEIAFSLSKFLENYIDYVKDEKSLGYMTFEDIMKERRGVCDEYSLSLNTLLKRLGFKTRFVTGYAKANEFESHAWSEVYVGDKWVPFDLTFSQYGYVNDDHIAYSINEEKVDPTSYTLSFYSSNGENANTEERWEFHETRKDFINSTYKIPYEIKSVNKINEKYSFITLIFENNYDFYIPLDFFLNNYREINYIDFNVAKKYYLFDLLQNSSFSQYNNREEIASFLLKKDLNYSSFINLIEKENLYSSGDFETLVFPNEKKEFVILMENNYNRTNGGYFFINPESKNPLISFSGQNKKLLIEKSLNDNSEILKFDLKTDINKENFCDLSFNSSLYVICDNKVCYDNYCAKEIKFGMKTLKDIDTIRLVDQKTKEIFEIPVDMYKKIREISVTFDDQGKKSRQVIGNEVFIDTFYPLRNINFHISTYLTPNKITINGREKFAFDPYLENTFDIDVFYDDFVISRRIEVINTYEKKKESYFMTIVMSIVIIFLISKLVFDLKESKRPLKRIEKHRDFSSTINGLSKDLFETLKILKNNLRHEHAHIFHRIRGTLTTLSKINRAYINIFKRVYDLDEILYSDKQKDIANKIDVLRSSLVTEKDSLNKVVRDIVKINVSHYDKKLDKLILDLDKKLDDFETLIIFLNITEEKLSKVKVK